MAVIEFVNIYHVYVYPILYVGLYVYMFLLNYGIVGGKGHLYYYATAKFGYAHANHCVTCRCTINSLFVFSCTGRIV